VAVTQTSLTLAPEKNAGAVRLSGIGSEKIITVILGLIGPGDAASRLNDVVNLLT